jgi:hypothetical protein
VEIEFAANISSAPDAPHEFAFLQIRPVVFGFSSAEVDLEKLNMDEAICVCNSALGNGKIDDVRDIVYVPKNTFDRSKTIEIAQEIGSITAKLALQRRPLLLIGPGRWGSADRWLGIPVTWQQIAGVRCIVETDMEDISVTPSQGTHFFQNITSFGIGYFTVSSKDDGELANMDWLDTQTAETELPHVRHLSFEHPLHIFINGKRGIGAIMKPGYRPIRQES